MLNILKDFDLKSFHFLLDSHSFGPVLATFFALAGPTELWCYGRRNGLGKAEGERLELGWL